MKIRINHKKLNQNKKQLFSACLAALLITSSLGALIFATMPVGAIACPCLTGMYSQESDQTIIDNLDETPVNLTTLINDYDEGTDLTEINLDDPTDIEWWMFSQCGDYETQAALIQFEYVDKEAGSTNIFGYYNHTENPPQLNQIFNTQTNSSGDLSEEILILNDATMNGIGLGIQTLPSNPDYETTYYTETTENTPQEDHALVYQISDSNYPESYLIAFEDYPRDHSYGKDYDDMIVIMHIVECNPSITLKDLTVNIEGQGSVQLDPTGGTYLVGTEVDLTAIPETGWTFSHWEDDLTSSNQEETIIMNTDKTVTANFTKEDIPLEDKTITLNATKIICPCETCLPNWGDESNQPPELTEALIQQYLDDHPECSIDETWEFEWALTNENNPGDHLEHGGNNWNTFSGTQTITLPGDTNKIWIREAFQSGYILFAGDSDQDNVSAELYAHKDIYKYDNYDFIQPIEDGETYQIIAFNAPVCDETIDLIQNGGFEQPIVDHNKQWNIYVDGTENLEWHVEWLDENEIPANIEIHAGVNGWQPAEGNQYAELDSDFDGPDGNINEESASTVIYQLIDTCPGRYYNLSFAFSPRPGRTAEDNNLTAVAFNAESDDGPGTPLAIKEISKDGTGLQNTDWEQYHVEFMAESLQTIVAFVDNGASNSFGTFLDDVSVHAICDPDYVPGDDDDDDVTPGDDDDDDDDDDDTGDDDDDDDVTPGDDDDDDDTGDDDDDDTGDDDDDDTGDDDDDDVTPGDDDDDDDVTPGDDDDDDDTGDDDDDDDIIGDDDDDVTPGDDDDDDDDQPPAPKKSRSSSSSNLPKNKPPVADIAEPYDYTVYDQPLTLDGRNSNDPDDGDYIMNYEWNLGDGTIKTGETVTHEYQSQGSYYVTLTVRDNHGAKNSMSTKINIVQPNRPPSKPLISGIFEIPGQKTYSFAASSTDPDGDDIKYTFNWGDDKSESTEFLSLPKGSVYNMLHAWEKQGEYTLTVTVTDGELSSASEIQVNILQPPIDPMLIYGLLSLVFAASFIGIFLFLKRKSVKPSKQ